MNAKFELKTNLPLGAGTVQHDTFEITKIYLQRPASLAGMPMSCWFCAAHGLTDFNLLQAASLGDLKQQLIDRGFVYLPLQPLHDYNKAMEKRPSYNPRGARQKF